MPLELVAAAGYLVHSGAVSNAANHVANVVHSLGAKAQHALNKAGATASSGKDGVSASAHLGDAGVSAQAKNGAASITAHVGKHTAHAQAGGSSAPSVSMKLARASHLNSANAYATKLPPKYQPYLHHTAKGSSASMKLAPGAVTHAAHTNSAGAYAHKIPAKGQPYLHPPAKVGGHGAGKSAHPGSAPAGAGGKGNWQHYAKQGGASATAGAPVAKA